MNKVKLIKTAQNNISYTLNLTEINGIAPWPLRIGKRFQVINPDNSGGIDTSPVQKIKKISNTEFNFITYTGSRYTLYILSKENDFEQ